MPSPTDAYERVVDWLIGRVVKAARGDSLFALDVEPEGLFWLGRLTTEAAVLNSGFGDRSERMEPCAIGFRIRPAIAAPWRFQVTVSGCAWSRSRVNGRNSWRKTGLVQGTVSVNILSDAIASYQFEATEFNESIRRELGVDVLRMSVRVDVEHGKDQARECVVTCVNESPLDSTLLADTGIYEAQLKVQGLPTDPFLLEALPDSFRYDRRLPAYGINCAVESQDHGILVSSDVVKVDRPRPAYWAVQEPEPNLAFSALAENPLPILQQLVTAHLRWGERVWSPDALDHRMRDEGWNQSMRDQARDAADEFREEAARLAAGLALLQSNEVLCRAFRMMNEAMIRASRGRYAEWRPFQIGFLIANIRSILGEIPETSVVDILWFATGGGKTETYLGLLVMAAFHDRMTGKQSGLTAWSRFPLRLLSLQQTQRFADAVAAAEIVRRNYGIVGDPFGLGFFVGDTSTPNRIKNDPAPGDPDPLDDAMPSRFQVLLRCPFCDASVEMAFNRRSWRLEHRCVNQDCEWPDDALPIYIVDEEIYRFLPTIIVGTLDKVASVSMQAAMKGFVSAPYGLCSEYQHGFTYAPRSQRPNGCLVPGCRGGRQPLPMDAARFPPTFRLQDELHLLRDSLGAIDAHYESLLDHLEDTACGVHPKIVASSATLTGFERQCDVLYRRRGRVFPVQGPSIRESFWSCDTQNLLRRYIALSPRGATLEFAADRILTECQRAIRELISNREEVCRHLDIDSRSADDVVSLYGTNVVYGNTIRDIDASVRSLETQVRVDGSLHTATLTGHTPFEEVRSILERLQRPEPAFSDRIHIVAASSMMSHGVDIDRLNSMVMLGQPLTTAEFIQATARIGRTFPGFVMVLHKMALERDASVFRSFKPFVEQGDRFVEAIPVTRHSRRVLERTLPGLVMARLLHVHEPNSQTALTVITRVRQYFADHGIDAASELAAIAQMLQWNSALEDGLRSEADRLLTAFFRNLNDPSVNERFPNQLFATGVMRSLRDVEEQAPIHD